MKDINFSNPSRSSVMGRRELLLTGAAASLLPLLSATASVWAQSSGTRLFKHALGETEIPVDPQRVVVLDQSCLHYVALGTPPVGAGNVSRDERIQPELDLSPIVDIITQNGQLDLEDVLNLDPDLIISTHPASDEVYDRLSVIAPTIMYDSSSSDQIAYWKERLRFYGDALNKVQAAEDLILAYDARVAHFKQRLADLGKQETVVSVVSIGANVDGGVGNIRICTQGGYHGSVLVDTGLRRPVSQDMDGDATRAINGNGDPAYYPISTERLQEADGDVLFTWGNPSTRPRGDEEQTNVLSGNMEALKADPLWRALKPVRENRFFEVGGHWRGFSIMEANLILDDLYRGVLEEEPA